MIALVTPPGARGGRAALGLRVYEDGAWRAFEGVRLADDAGVVLLVHGLDEPGDVWDDLTPALADAGHTPVRFDYPNDQAVERSGAMLADALGMLRDSGVDRVSIVAHSMGGLVTLDALTREPGPDARKAPEVERLITLGTPFGGSPWAGMRWAGELREQIQRLGAEGLADLSDLRRFLDDGRGEAGADLAPGSPLLTDLLARPRPGGVAITCVRGRVFTPPAGSPTDLVAFAPTLGAGVVPIASAALPGVGDVVELNANPRAMVRRLPFANPPRPPAGDDDADPGVPPAIPVILERLARPPGATAAPAPPPGQP